MEGELRRRFLALAEDPAALEAARRLLSLLPPGEWGRPREKRRTLGAYRNLSLGIAGDKKTLRSLKTALKGRPLGILGELNGSARGAGIDASFLARLGVRPRILNGVPGQVVHRIVPEGESLDLCCRELEKLRKGDPSFQLGYVPDNDGDRGNLVYFDTREGRAKALGAQEVFALSVLGVLAWEKLRSPAPPEALALVVNGPTSLRIDYLAARWGARVFRGEVGEANMINLARQLRAQGWRVPVLGEGSNGGNITYPATVRDPLNTLIALIRLLRLPALNPGGEPRELPDLLESLPAFTTSSAFEEAAVLPLRAENPGELKGRYEEIFLKDWEARREVLASWGLDHFKEFNYEGTEEREGWGPGFRRGRQTGGLKIQFYGPPEEPPRGFLWFRGSGTEPVLRIMADIQGRDNRRMAELLAWQRDMILRAFQKLG
jgi:phosphomannomutase